MSRHIGFAIGFGLSGIVALMLSAPILLGDCYVTGQDDLIQACLTSKRHAVQLYFGVAIVAGIASISLHRRGLRFETFFALVALMIAPLVIATQVRF